jgi:hypothetical protein
MSPLPLLLLNALLLSHAAVYSQNNTGGYDALLAPGDGVYSQAEYLEACRIKHEHLSSYPRPLQARVECADNYSYFNVFTDLIVKNVPFFYSTDPIEVSIASSKNSPLVDMIHRIVIVNTLII